MNLEPVGALLRAYETPFYVFFPDTFTAHCRELTEAYEAIYKPFSIAYSFKTNYLPAALRCVRALDGYAEVVSDHEYAIAKRVGFAPERIIVNGPGKWYGMEEMIADGAILMLDNAYELERTMRLAEKLGRKATVGFRLNFDIGTNKASRFGFEAESEETAAAVERARAHEKLRIVGLHFHLGGSRSLEAWKARAEKMTAFVGQLLHDGERQIVDLGSGMFGHLHPDFAAQFNQPIPCFREYAETVAGVFAEKYGALPPERRPKLIVEPGATVIADTMLYVTRVIAAKTVRGRAIAVVDGSVHQLGELGKKKRLPVHILPGGSDEPALFGADVGGFTCLEDDLLCRGLAEPVRVGDALAFENAGAYTNVMKPPFIRAGCKILCLSSDGAVSLAKRDEKADDMLSAYEV